MCDHSLTRRNLLAGVTVGVGACVLPKWLWATGSDAAPAIRAEQALQLLKEGNARFQAGQSEVPNLTPQRIAETASHGQHPFATIISCSDSRVPVEHVFDRGIGDLFVIRVAGNVADTDEIGTAEYGAGHLHTPLIVVLGHTRCGAVTAVVKGDGVGGSIPKLVDNIVPAAQRAKDKGLSGDELVLDAIRENVRQSIGDLRAHSEELRHLEHEGKLQMVGAVYHLEDGSVEWLMPESQGHVAPAATDGAPAEVEQTINAWVQAWRSRDLQAYTAFYSDSSFVPEQFIARADWQASRARILKEAGTIQITLSDIRIAMEDADTARALFTQSYRSKRHRDTVNKTLILVRENGSWKIIREFVEPAN
ncbi:MAG: nuclear transport factor 2 family protein [Magnetococcus sp. MYC-9]